MLLDALSRILLQASERRPLLVLLDDLHWADGVTIEALAAMAPELRRHALLVVASQRDAAGEYRARRPPQLARYAERIDVPPLLPDDVGQYIGHFTRGGWPPAGLTAAVHRTTAGNPLFLQETVRALVAQHGAAGLPALSPAEVMPPQLARDVLAERFAALDPQTYAVLAMASVIGESFDTNLLQRVASLDVESLIDGLDGAMRAGLISAEGDHRYRFRHALVRDVLYDGLPARMRIATHRAAAVAIERVSHGGPQQGELAQHYYRSLALGEAAAVAATARAAAEEALRSGELEAAALFSQWALEAQALDLDAAPRDRAELLPLRAPTARHAG
jgi:predicted ATPase